MVGIVTGLQLLQQFTIVMETRVVTAAHQFAERCDGEVRLPNSAGTHQQETALSASRVISGKSLHDHLGLGQASIPSSPFRSPFPNVDFEVFEVAMFITARDARPGQIATGPIRFGTLA